MPITSSGLATSFITFSRPGASGGGATTTDRDGKIKWAGHNLLTNSESFDASAWTKAAGVTTVTANAIAAPNGTTTADLITSGSGDGSVYQSVTLVAGVTYTFSVWLKAQSPSSFSTSLQIYNPSDTGTTQTITVTSEWQMFSLTKTVSQSGGYLIFVGGSSTLSNENLYAWGAHLYRSDLGGMQLNPAQPAGMQSYYPTTPRNLLGYTESFASGWTGSNGGLQGNGVEANTDPSFNTPSAWTAGTGITVSGGDAVYASPAHGTNLDNTSVAFVAGKTYVVNVTVSAFTSGRITVYLNKTTGTTAGGVKIGGATGVYQVLITPATNGTGLGLQADGVTAGACVMTLSSVTVQELISYDAPNGLSTARAVEALAANGTLLGSVSLLASPYTFSIWLKRKTGSGNVQLTVDGTTYATVSVTDTWTRFSTTLTPSAGTKTPGIRLVTSGDAVYAWGAQLSDSASLDTYVPVYGAAVTSAAYYAPRLDFDGATLAAKGLLVEEQRTNACTYSNEMTNAAWTKSNATVNTTTATTSPDGTNSAFIVTAQTTARAFTARTNSVSSFTSAVGSVYVKAGNQTRVCVTVVSGFGFVRQWFDLSAITTGSFVESSATKVSASIIDAGNSWRRCSLAITATAASSVDIAIDVVNADNTLSATSGDFIYAWGAQIETAAPFPTSYIPTIGNTTATRAADVASVSTGAFPYSASEGTLVVSWQLAQLSGSPAAIHLTDDAENNRIRINAHLAGINRSTITASGSLVANIDTSTAATGVTKYALGGKSADYAVYRNGSAGGTSTNSGFPSGCTELRIGRDGASGNFNGHIRQITYLPRRISNAELQSRSA